MSKILMINLPFSGHVNPTLPLTAELVKRGHKVDYICSEQFRDAIETTGADFIPYSSFPVKPTGREKKRLSFQAAFDTAIGLKNIYDIYNTTILTFIICYVKYNGQIYRKSFLKITLFLRQLYKFYPKKNLFYTEIL